MFSILLYLLLSIVTSYNQLLLYKAVRLSAAAYCHKDIYSTMMLDNDFLYNTTIYDRRSDLQGFIGITPGVIWVVLRGTSSARNWARDLEARRIEYTTFPECNCSVHQGFYLSAEWVHEDTLVAVRRLLVDYPLSEVVLTGHSYGAACSQLLAMELYKNGIQTNIYTFGSPRVGDSAYSIFMTSFIKHFRITHSRDIVPHVPPKQMGYIHSSHELWENETEVLIECIDNDEKEDPYCNAQYKLIDTSIDDHLVYLGQPMQCLYDNI